MDLKNVGIDIGTNSLVSAIMDDSGSPIFKMQRDAFYVIKPKTEVNRNSIRMSLNKRGANYIVDEDGSFVVVGQDALDIAIERNDIAMRPMQKGVISPKNKASMPILKLLIEGLIGKGNNEETCIYSVPAKPIDSVFDIQYHQEVMGLYIRQLGFIARPINEAYAIALSELLDSGLTGISISFGSGLTNVCVVHEGEPLIEFSMVKGGDTIDTSVGNALDMSPSIVQMEKESGTDLLNPSTKVMEAVSVYYSSVINYVMQNISYELKNKEKAIPLFGKPIPIVVAGGLTLANGFVNKIEEALSQVDFPIKIDNIVRAEEPMKAVAAGALLATNIESL